MLFIFIIVLKSSAKQLFICWFSCRFRMSNYTLHLCSPIRSRRQHLPRRHHWVTLADRCSWHHRLILCHHLLTCWHPRLILWHHRLVLWHCWLILWHHGLILWWHWLTLWHHRLILWHHWCVLWHHGLRLWHHWLILWWHSLTLFYHGLILWHHGLILRHHRLLWWHWLILWHCLIHHWILLIWETLLLLTTELWISHITHILTWKTDNKGSNWSATSQIHSCSKRGVQISQKKKQQKTNKQQNNLCHGFPLKVAHQCVFNPSLAEWSQLIWICTVCHYICEFLSKTRTK